MPTPHALILRAPGTNCDLETAHAFGLAGATTSRVHINELQENPRLAQEAQIFCVPGGFSYGDDLAAGRVLAGKIRHYLYDTLSQFKADDKLILGICNGFQVLIQTGILIAEHQEAATCATLTDNDSGRFEDRWVDLIVDGRHSVFLRGLSRMYLPVAHAEGKFVTASDAILDRLNQNKQLVLRYTKDSQSQMNGQVPYPQNPNGSLANVAGMSDETGRVLGMMPHPERFVHRTHHPRWTREQLPEQGDGLAIFENAVHYFNR